MGEGGDDRLSSARNWTTVTDDTRLIVNLLKSWHRWEYGYWHFMDWGKPHLSLLAWLVLLTDR